ncbi:MAG: hypothetical protein KBG15_03850 [Kofleriaceae bacterium]|nr:hypothetical protein [Kofleriaceae bacterium]
MQPTNRGFLVVVTGLLGLLMLLGLSAGVVHAKRMPGSTSPPRPPATMPAASAGSVVMLTFAVPLVFASATTADCRTTNNQGDVQLLLMQRDPVGAPGVVSVGLFNRGATTVCVESHIATHEIQDDRLEVSVATRNKPRTAVVVRFSDDRDKSAPVIVTLPPGATAWHDLDVVAWAARSVNGRRKLPAAPRVLTATYATSGQTGVWQGTSVASIPLGQP